MNGHEHIKTYKDCTCNNNLPLHVGQYLAEVRNKKDFGETLPLLNSHPNIKYFYFGMGEGGGASKTGHILLKGTTER